MPSSQSRQDAIYAALLGDSKKSIIELERARLITATGASTPARRSLYDLYALAGEKPRLF